MTPTAPPRDDEHLLRLRFRDRQHGAMRDVHQRYAAGMRALARALLRDRELASDAVQQAFLQAWRSADRYDPERPLGPWLFQITRRACIDAFRRDRRQQPAKPVADADVDLVVVDDHSALEQRWVTDEVRRAVASLPPPERSVAHLAHLEGLSHQEIARRLSVPIGTVKSRSARAHARLAGLLHHLAPVPA